MIAVNSDRVASIVATGGYTTIGMTIGGKYVAVTMPSQDFKLSLLTEGVKSDGDCLADWIKNNK